MAVVVATTLHRHRPPAILLTSLPAINLQPSSQPAHHRLRKIKYPNYMDLVRTQNPNIPATQPLDFPVELPDAAHLILHDPVYLDPIGNLWITSALGQPAITALDKPGDAQEHIITDRPVFVHWWTDEAGQWSAAMIVADQHNGFDLVTKKGRRHLAADRHFRWSTAYSLLGKIVVCGDVGVSVFEIDPDAVEHYHALPGCGIATSPPTTLLDTRGVLAWSPWENGKAGSHGVSRFVDDGWTDLPGGSWPARPVQLSMLLDGSVLRIAGDDPSTSLSPDSMPAASEVNADHINPSIGLLEPTQLDEKHINDLITQLGDDDSDLRQASFDELSRYGPELAPLLEKTSGDASPEAALRIQQLLRNKVAPALGGITAIDGRLDVIRRFDDGTVLFFAPAGVQVATARDQPDVIAPAWLVLRPDGHMERPLSAAIVRDQQPNACTLISLHDEWLVADAAGIRRFTGNTFEPLLHAVERRFSKIIGIDARHRWILKDPASSHDTLIIDPSIIDPTPRLPTWTIAINDGAIGWDAEGFPAVSRGADPGTWELRADGWKMLANPATIATNRNPPPARQAATAPSSGIVLLTATDGCQYFGGADSLIEVSKTGSRTHWPLPPNAVGSAEPILIQTVDGLLYLYNQPGRLLRIRRTIDGIEPFTLEAIFTQGIPNTDHPIRVWLDPAGRIDFIGEDNVLTIAFPAGAIPKEISRMMLDKPR